jgi:hypothetical protein
LKFRAKTEMSEHIVSQGRERCSSMLDGETGNSNTP